MHTEVHITAIADEVSAALNDRRQISPFSSRPGGFTFAESYRVTPLLRAALEAVVKRSPDARSDSPTAKCARCLWIRR